MQPVHFKDLPVSAQDFKSSEFDRLCKLFNPQFKSLAQTYKVSVDDVRQDAAVAFFSDKKFDATKGKVESRFSALIRYSSSKNYAQNLHTDQFEDYFSEVLSAEEKVEVEDWRKHDIVNLDGMSDQLKLIIDFAIEGDDFDTIAAKMGLSRRRIQQIAAVASSDDDARILKKVFELLNLNKTDRQIASLCGIGLQRARYITKKLTKERYLSPDCKSVVS